ncbi:hypothetical protein [Micromonospora thermarum]|uniref:hypothetical protein n=1 Tax=Micromonospora thermarum TaxID=2720024 RepID=UPI001F106098|nr:hypothetical protein [Micromonospora thermarum]
MPSGVPAVPRTRLTVIRQWGAPESACPLVAGCRLRGELRRAQAAFLAVLDGVRLDDQTAPLLLTLSAPDPRP